MGRRGAFTLVEMMVVIAVVAVLMSLVIPSLNKARATAIRLACASNMHQQAVMTAQYAADTKGNLPCPTTPHRLNKYTLGGIDSASKSLYAQNALVKYTRGDADGSVLVKTGPCPDTSNGAGGCTARTMPTGYGWFYYMGYLPNPGVKKRQIAPTLECPGTPRLRNVSGNLVSGPTPTEASAGEISTYIGILSSRSIDTPNNNPGGNNVQYCCYSRGEIEYYNRGWNRGSLTTPVARVERWSPGNAWAVDGEAWLGTSPQYDAWQRKHGGQINIMFIDGHVSFGGKEITLAAAGRAVPPTVYYTSAVGGKALALAWEASSGVPGSVSTNVSDTTMNALWAYYESGN